MKDARLDGPRTREAVDDATSADGSNRQCDPEELDVVPARDWTRRVRTRSETPLLVHWIDEKGAVVRLISSSTDTDAEARGA